MAIKHSDTVTTPAPSNNRLLQRYLSAGYTLPVKDVPPQDAMSPIKVGIIGAGNMTRKNHLPELERLRAAGVCDIRIIADINLELAQQVAEKYGIPEAVHKPESVIAADVDAVCIFAPADIHYRYGLAALAAGKHLFVEKPPAKNTSQLIEMRDAAERARRIAVVGLNRRFQEPIVEVTKRIAPGSILSAEAVFHKPNAGVPAPFGMRSWLGANSIHALDVLCFVMGERPTALWSVARGTGEDQENFGAVIEWDGRFALFSANNSAGSRTERYSFNAYGITLSTEAETLTISRDSEEKDEVIQTADDSRGLYGEFAAFFDAIRTGTEPVHSITRAIPSLYLVELIESEHHGSIDWSFLGASTHGKPESAEIYRGESYTRPSVLILNPKPMKTELPLLAERFNVVFDQDLATLSKEKRAEIRAIMTGGQGGVPVTPAHFELLPNVAIVAVCGASVKRWGGALALERGIPVVNTADTFADAVAEFIVMQAMVGLRRASMTHDAIRHGDWGFAAMPALVRLKRGVFELARRLTPGFIRAMMRSRFPALTTTRKPKTPSRMLHGRTVGIIGWGEITKKTIPLFKALGARVRVASEHMDTKLAAELGAEHAALEHVLLSDVVSLQRGLSPRTLHSFGAREINALRPGAVLVNSARAGLIDAEALSTRLKKGDIFACLDVFDTEPPKRRDPIRRFPNVFLTSHIAGSLSATEGLQERSNKRLVEKLSAFFAGEPIDAINERFDNMT